MDKPWPQIVGIGELLIDFTQEREDAMGYPVLAAHPGGAPANYLAAAQRYGASTAMIAKCGADRFGALLKGTLDQAGIDTSGIVTDETVFTTLAFVTLDRNGERAFSFARKPGADTCLKHTELALALIDGAELIHFGTLSLSDEPSRSATLAALERARTAGKCISFDPNIRMPLWSSEDWLNEQLELGFSYADIVKISEDEVAYCFHCDHRAGAEILMKKYGVKAVFVTLGAEGCFYATPRFCGSVAAPKAAPVVDTTGAGDIFGGAAIACLMPHIRSVDAWQEPLVRQACRFACAAATLSTGYLGGISSIQDRAAVEAFLQGAEPVIS